jgi:glycosyltransferase involved in cell wall biosynthesis
MQQPRFSVVVPVRNRADTVGRTLCAVLTQTFADLEVVLVDDGSSDDTARAAAAVADTRVRVVHLDGVGAPAAIASGLDAARGRWAALLDADTEVAAGWLARLGRLADATGAAFVSCGGEQCHADGSTTEVGPLDVGHGRSTNCLRPGAFATDRRVLGTVARRLATTSAADDGSATAAAITAVGRAALVGALADDGRGPASTHTPERLIVWHDARTEDPPEGDELRLHWSFQALDALSRTPIPDGGLLARVATVGGVAAARLHRHDDAQALFRIAVRAMPEVRKHWTRWAVSLVPPLSERVWSPEPDGSDAEPDPAVQHAGAVAGSGAVDLAASA